MPQWTLQKISSPFAKNKFLKMSFNYKDATLWNSLPCDLRPERSFSRFKQLLNRRHIN